MMRADLHCHSRFSNHPSEWFLKRLGSAESYTDPDFVYSSAKARGMRFVTVTDHNRIEASVYLRDRFPGEAFTGVESTVYFPDNRAKVHILLWGFTEEDFAEIERIRTDIFVFRDFVLERGIAHSVAHAAFSVDNRLRPDQLEKLVLMFNVFEGLNGSRTRSNNANLLKALRDLTPERIEDLRRAHGIEPTGDEPWIKGFTGGSDDHAGLFIGQTYTEAEGESVEEFLDSIRRKASCPGGRTDDYKTFAFAVYKIAYDFSESRGGLLSRSLLPQISTYLLDRGRRDAGHTESAAEMLSRTETNLRTLRSISAGFTGEGSWDMTEKLDAAYEMISGVLDDLSRELIGQVAVDLERLDIGSLLRNVASALPAAFLTAPFFSTFRHMQRERRLVQHLLEKFSDGRPSAGRKILWFTDTFADLNGVSATLRTIARVAEERELNIRVATCLNDHERRRVHTGGVVDLPHIFEFPIPHYPNITLKAPSVLGAMKRIEREAPDEIYISTPGPVGLLALALGKLLGVRTVGVFHTDFTMFAEKITLDESLAEVVDTFMRWFYSACDSVSVPTREYQSILERRGIDPARMTLFHRGIEADLFSPTPDGREYLRDRFHVKDGVNLLFAGRVSREKNVDVLADVYHRLSATRSDINLLIAGDGPYLGELKERVRPNGRVIFTGALDRTELPRVYSGSDLFVFPSTADTFGMAVLEAQACGLPALVSNEGGPQEIISHGETGWVVDGAGADEWTHSVAGAIEFMDADRDRYDRMRTRCRERVVQDRDWSRILGALL
ncbi:MAG: glycosyltransferase [Deltaproteobacteria bacterium]|nr:glycosyltransferase [Deltaproteobacteria bacterium]